MLPSSGLTVTTNSKSLTYGGFFHGGMTQMPPSWVQLIVATVPTVGHDRGLHRRVLMRTCVSCIQPNPHGAILRHLLNTVNSFLCSSYNYFENRLLPNDLIIVRNHGDDEEDERDMKRALERQGDAYIKVEIQSNSEFQSLTMSPTRSLGSSRLQIDVLDAYKTGFGHSTYTWIEEEINFLMALVLGPTKIGFEFKPSRSCSH
jgi:hypothetical protein